MDRKMTPTGPAGSDPEAASTPAGIYVHIPFCQKKCPYCSFVSYAGIKPQVRAGYIRALTRQALTMAGHPWSGTRKFHTLFIGGGTPSAVDPEQMAMFIATCCKAFGIRGPNSAAEVSFEANPNTVNAAMLKQFRQAGVNRLSLGMQSFSDALLKKIGRKHSVRQGIRAFDIARAAGFTNINLDLMYGLPGQDVSTWKKSLDQALALGPEHLSVYELTVEPNTPFAELAARGKLNLPSEDAALAMLEHTREVLAANGYGQYEISNYARRGFACRHNINYWENGSYVGLGAGAVSCFSGVRV
ncbi:MAG: radical SAM family heme chaperone HemW, partial [Desulfobulbales bacterium]|nr:radical SAM family heme chaperone HemW [Desulfobulbales bacterium]